MRTLQVLFIVFIVAGVCGTQAHAQGKSGKQQSQGVKQGGGPPPWAPAHGYRAKTRYVYFKDYGVYYDHDRGVYISIGGNNWNISARLPDVLKGVNLSMAAKIDLDFDGDEPQKEYSVHKKKFPKG